MAHIIRRQYLHVELNGTESEGLALQSRLSGLCQDWLNPVLERALDRCAPPDEYWSIERLDIEAGALNLERLEHDLAESIAQALEKALREQIPSRGNYLIAHDNYNVKHKTAQQTLKEAFIYFLKTGSLPWAFRLLEGKSLEQTMLEVWQESDRSSVGFHLFNDSVVHALASVTARKRLIWQFSSVFLEIMLAGLSPDGKKAIDSILHALHSSDVPPAELKQFEKQLWETAFALISKGGTITEKLIVGETWRTLPVSSLQKTALTSFLKDHWPDVAQDPTDRSPSPEALLAKLSIEKHISGETSRTTPVPVVQPTVLTDSLESHWPDVTQGTTSHPQSSEITGKILDEPLSHAAQGASIPDEPNFPTVQEQEKKLMEALETSKKENYKAGYSSKEVMTSPRESESSQSQHPDEKEGIYIQNAGLVILHPFLPQFFEALGITAEDKLLKPERALCLLHFLITGQSIAPEYELILPKILCNIPLETPVESDMELTDSEKEEAEALLLAVIRHWDVLKNTGIDGLRGTFLLRLGKLCLRNDGDWLLQVESKAYDILLNHLPWGIAMIKLPWMQRMLWVEWTN
ncbi:MAG: contractile injection system tape measure protein [Methylococcales bacterium]|nr:contractile injection system tape measure protein [Methylococcales bacterium]